MIERKPAFRRTHPPSSTELAPDLAAGLTVAAMLVPQAMAYALLAGLPPEVGLYAATVPLLAYAMLGTSRQLAVGPVAIVSLLTASALAPIVEEGTAGYAMAAALLAVMVGVVHVVFGIARLGIVVNFLAHSVLVGFTAAAAIIIGASQAKHFLGIRIERHDHFYEQVTAIVGRLDDVHWWTVGLGLVSLLTLLALRKHAPRIPASLTVVLLSVTAVELLDLGARGVGTVGDIPGSLPSFDLPELDGSVVGRLVVPALVITLVGFMESTAVAKIYARRGGYALEPNRELLGLGAANIASGLFGGYPVTGGFSRTAVNADAGARTQRAAIVTALIVVASIAFLTPLLASIPNAALASIIIVAVAGLIDRQEIRYIAAVSRTDFLGLVAAFVATLALGIELGIAVTVVASLLVALRSGRRVGPADEAAGLGEPPSRDLPVPAQNSPM